MAQPYSLHLINKETLQINTKQLFIGDEFFNLLFRDTDGNRELRMFRDLMYKYHGLDNYIRGVATPLDNQGKLLHNYIDIGMKTNGLVSYVPSEKVTLPSGEINWVNSTIQTMKFGKFIKSFFHPTHLSLYGIGDAQLERMAAFVKGKYSMDDYEIEILTGDKIKWAYSERNHMSYPVAGGEATSSIVKSCMRHDKCQDWFSVYTKDERIKMVLLKHKPSNKVAARALLWHDVKVNGSSPSIGVETIQFMDRVYAYREWMIQYMLDWASANGYWRKYKQAMDYKMDFVSPSGVSYTLNLEHKAKEIHNFFPYLDTFTFLQGDKLTFNNDGRDRVWNLTEWQTGNIKVNMKKMKSCSCCGVGYEESNMRNVGGSLICHSCIDEMYKYSERYGVFIHQDECTYLEYLDDYAYDHETVYDELAGEPILQCDAVECINHEGNWIWTREENTVIGHNDVRYQTGHPRLIIIDDEYYHENETFVCSHDGQRYPDYKMTYIRGVVINIDNIDDYIAANGMIRNENGEIIDAPILEEVVAEPVTDSTPSTVEATTTTPRRRGPDRQPRRSRTN